MGTAVLLVLLSVAAVDGARLANRLDGSLPPDGSLRFDDAVGELSGMLSQPQDSDQNASRAAAARHVFDDIPAELLRPLYVIVSVLGFLAVACTLHSWRRIPSEQSFKSIRTARDMQKQTYNKLLDNAWSFLQQLAGQPTVLAELTFQEKLQSFITVLAAFSADGSAFVQQKSLVAEPFRVCMMALLGVFKSCCWDPDDEPLAIVDEGDLTNLTTVADIASHVSVQMSAIPMKFMTGDITELSRLKKADRDISYYRWLTTYTWFQVFGLLTLACCLVMAGILHVFFQQQFLAAVMDMSSLLFIGAALFISWSNHYAYIKADVEVMRERIQVLTLQRVTMKLHHYKMLKWQSLWEQQTLPFLQLSTELVSLYFRKLSFSEHKDVGETLMDQSCSEEALAKELASLGEGLRSAQSNLGSVHLWSGPRTLKKSVLDTIATQIKRVTAVVQQEKRASHLVPRIAAYLNDVGTFLVIRVIGCANLLNGNGKGLPYVVVQLGGQEFRQASRTGNVRGDTNPVFNSECVMSIRPDDVAFRVEVGVASEVLGFATLQFRGESDSWIRATASLQTSAGAAAGDLDYQILLASSLRALEDPSRQAVLDSLLLHPQRVSVQSAASSSATSSMPDSSHSSGGQPSSVGLSS